MDQAQYALKEGGRDAAQEGDNVLTELERLKKADVQLKQLLEETLSVRSKLRTHDEAGG